MVPPRHLGRASGLRLLEGKQLPTSVVGSIRFFSSQHLFLCHHNYFADCIQTRIELCKKSGLMMGNGEAGGVLLDWFESWLFVF